MLLTLFMKQVIWIILTLLNILYVTSIFRRQEER